MRIKSLLAVALFIVLMLAVSACGNKAEDAKSSKSGKKTEDVKSKEDTTVTSSITVDDILQQITEKNDDGATSAPATNTTPASAVPTTTEAPRNNDDLSDDGAPEPEPTEIVTPEPTAEPTPTPEVLYCPECGGETEYFKKGLGLAESDVESIIHKCKDCGKLWAYAYAYDDYNLMVLKPFAEKPRLFAYDRANNNVYVDIDTLAVWLYGVNANSNSEMLTLHLTNEVTKNAKWDAYETFADYGTCTLKNTMYSGVYLSAYNTMNDNEVALLNRRLAKNAYNYGVDENYEYTSPNYSRTYAIILPKYENIVFGITITNANELNLSNEDLLSQVIEPMLADIEYEPYVIEQ